MGSTSGMPPASRTHAAMAGAFELRIFAPCGTWSCGTSSEPVAIMATRGRVKTGTSTMPQPARKPTPALFTTSPACTTASPARASSPAARTFCPAFAGAVKLTRPPVLPSPDTTPTISYFTQVSAHAGSFAPVMMRTHCPSSKLSVKSSPAAISATTSSSMGASSLASAIWSARRAYPSMATCAKGALSMSAVRSAAATRPQASSRSTLQEGRTCVWSRTISRAFSRETISGMAWCLSLRARFVLPEHCSA